MTVMGICTFRLGLVFLLMTVVGCAGSASGQPSGVQGDQEQVIDEGLDTQLKINRHALLEGSDEQIRVDAATILLYSSAPEARDILLEALLKPYDLAARVAVCKALALSRTSDRPVQDKEGFVMPLLDLLALQADSAGVKLVAEAMLAFEPARMIKLLEDMASDTSLSAESRINAMYALKLQPDFRAIFTIIELLDDQDAMVAGAAESQLKSIGIPVPTDPDRRRQYINQLRHNGTDAFLRDLWLAQEIRVAELSSQRDFWRDQYLLAMDQVYGYCKDETARSQFLADKLAAPVPEVRLWGLDRLATWRMATKSKLPVEQLEPALLKLISDPDRRVRLKASGLLALMVEVNSSQAILKQMESETDDEVRNELFVALGGACRFALSPNSGLTVPPEVGEQTLKWAARYLSEAGPKKPQKAAEVISRLLVPAGLTAEQTSYYLSLLAERYGRTADGESETLRADLLRAMAELCSQSSIKPETIRLFGPLFEQGLSAESDLGREAAVDGLVCVDKAQALRLLRNGHLNDPSARVRARAMELAGDAGSDEDLLWLWDKLKMPGENETAWLAMLKILKRSGTEVIAAWLQKFGATTDGKILSVDQMLGFMEIAERKAVADNRPEILRSVRREMAEAYFAAGDFRRAAEYWGLLYESADPSGDDGQQILARLLETYLCWPNIEMAVQIVHNRLLQKDLTPESPLISVLDRHIRATPAAIDPDALMRALAALDRPTDDRPLWARQMQQWSDYLAGQGQHAPH